MMTDELPPVHFLDAAAKAGEWTGWVGALDCSSPSTQMSIIAHARTLQQLAKYERPPVDEAELKRRQDAREAETKRSGSDSYAAGASDDDICIQSAYIALCHRDNVTPVPVEEWGK